MILFCQRKDPCMVILENNKYTKAMFHWMSPERDFYTANELNRMGCQVHKIISHQKFPKKQDETYLRLNDKFWKKSLRKSQARVRTEDPRLGFLILSFWTVYLNINISSMNLITEIHFFRLFII